VEVERAKGGEGDACTVLEGSDEDVDAEGDLEAGEVGEAGEEREDGVVECFEAEVDVL
jgi:hypothetical protein